MSGKRARNESARIQLSSGSGVERLCRRVDRGFTDVCLSGIRLRDSIHSVDCC